MKLKRICICCIFWLVSFMYAENVWFFPPPTYYQWLDEYLQPFSVGDTRIWHMGGTTGDVVKVPAIVCDDKYIYAGSTWLDRKDISIDGNLYQKTFVKGSTYIIIEGGGIAQSLRILMRK